VLPLSIPVLLLGDNFVRVWIVHQVIFCDECVTAPVMGKRPMVQSTVHGLGNFVRLSDFEVCILCFEEIASLLSTVELHWNLKAFVIVGSKRERHSSRTSDFRRFWIYSGIPNSFGLL
jgi:hypothetical protein